MSNVIPFPSKSPKATCQLAKGFSGRTMPASHAWGEMTKFISYLTDTHNNPSVMVIRGNGEIRIKFLGGGQS
ncbi:hypothetical protein [Maridesulfovibrio ferrireducens]|uniref:hypothetical protein n=1 Tax=Maridesulfovibrio ferrireducens TaxID=246191 RepID=UPI001A2F174E|nr:hypothetical protein [Maridesulfovibrio ferrireducens]MBI9112264.1 hypothetical protein [Maridesulfovibrio ferrireducens]